MVEVELESMWSVDVGLVVEEVEVVGGRAEENREEEDAMAVSGVMGSVELGGGDAVLVTDEIKLTEQAEETGVESSLAPVTELAVVVIDISDMLAEGKEAVVVTEIAASPPPPPPAPAAGVASTERIQFGSGKVDLVDRFVDAVEAGLSLLGVETVSEVVMEGVVIVVELEVTERLGVMDSEEVEGAVTVVEDSVGLVVLVRMGRVGSSAVSALALRTEGLLSSSVTFVGVVAAPVAFTESVHISVSEGGTLLGGETVKLVESGTEFGIVSAVGLVVAVRAGAAGVDGAAVGLSLVGVFVSPSCIWASSFSGVLRPDVVGGRPGLRTGFGSKAGFPAASCADTLGRI